MEGANRNIEGTAPEVGVYVGIQQMEYGGMAAPYLSKIGPYSATGGPFSVAAGRMSFIYGLKGPAVRPDPPQRTCIGRRLPPFRCPHDCHHLVMYLLTSGCRSVHKHSASGCSERRVDRGMSDHFKVSPSCEAEVSELIMVCR